MKIIITAQGKEKTSLMDARFGRCQYFHVYDYDKGFIKAIENRANQATGGAGIKAANLILKEKPDVIITSDVGPNAGYVLKNNEIKVFVSDLKKVSDVFADFKENKLEEISI